MKLRIATIAAATLFAAAMTMAADGSWTGWISDSQCGAKGANAKAAECTAKCVKGGAKYVFVNDADKKVYVDRRTGQSSGACRPSRHREGSAPTATR